jgi:hypothetical protein
MSAPEFFRVSMMFREMIAGAGPATLAEAISCLPGMTNAANIQMDNLSGRRDAKARLGDAWLNLYDAEKAMKS